MINRILIYVHHDRDNIVDDHVLFCIQQLKTSYKKIIFIHNDTHLSEEYENKVRKNAFIIKREDKQRDWGAWKEYILSNRNYLGEFDELSLLNSSVYGPLFSLDPILEKMSSSDQDFWTITKWSTYIPEHLDVLPHYQPYFITFKKKVFNSKEFQKFWIDFKLTTNNYWDLVVQGEIGLSESLKNASFKGKTMIDDLDTRPLYDIGHCEPFSQNSTSYLIEKYKIPFIKVKSFKTNEHRPLSIATDIFNALKNTGSDYPKSLIISHTIRTQPLSTWRSFPHSIKIFDSHYNKSSMKKKPNIAVFFHVFFEDEFNKYLKFLNNIHHNFDLFITTNNLEKKKNIIEIMEQENITDMAKVQIFIFENKGRDILPWLKLHKIIKKKYDLILKIHTKKHTQMPEIFSHQWKNYLLENLIGSKMVVNNIISEFVSNPFLGILFPPYPKEFMLVAPNAFRGGPKDTFFFNSINSKLKLKHPIEDNSYLFSAGTMFWYRPSALNKLLANQIINDSDFPEEPIKNENSIAYGIERAIPYIAQDAGYNIRIGLTLDSLLNLFLVFQERILSKYVSSYDQVKINTYKNKSIVKNFYMTIKYFFKIFKKKKSNFIGDIL